MRLHLIVLKLPVIVPRSFGVDDLGVKTESGHNSTGQCGLNSSGCRNNISLPFMRKASPTTALRRMAGSQLKELRRHGFSGPMIRALLRALVEEKERYRANDALPTIGDYRSALRTVQTLAIRLTQAMQGADPAIFFSEQFCGYAPADSGVDAAWLSRELDLFSDRCSEYLARIPTQSRRRNHANIIARVAAITGPLKIHISPREGTDFYQICWVAFSLAGVTKVTAKKRSRKKKFITPPSPSASIRSFMRDTKPETSGLRKTRSLNIRDFAGNAFQNSHECERQAVSNS